MFDFNDINMNKLCEYLTNNIPNILFSYFGENYIKLENSNNSMLIISKENILYPYNHGIYPVENSNNSMLIIISKENILYPYNHGIYPVVVENIKEYLNKFHNYQIIKF